MVNDKRTGMTQSSEPDVDEDFEHLVLEANGRANQKSRRGRAWLNCLVMLSVTGISGMFMPLSALLDIVLMAMGADLMRAKDMETKSLGQSLLLVGSLNLAAAVAFVVMVDA